MYHKPVLLHESVGGLNIQPEGIYIDATFGGGGHAREILSRMKDGRLIAFDQDQEALENKIDDERLVLLNHNFRYLKNFLRLEGISQVDGIIADLGISSHQIDQAQRGFSTRFEGPLDLRMNRNSPVSGADMLMTIDEERLAEILSKYGDLPMAKKMAAVIIRKREEKEIATTVDLKNAISGFVERGREQKLWARVFQALRMEVNHEEEALREFLLHSLDVLKTEGRLVVIAYHSIEDRLVKNFMRAGNFEGELVKDFYGKPQQVFKLISRKAILASEQEIEENNRARSARLRIAEKI